MPIHDTCLLWVSTSTSTSSLVPTVVLSVPSPSVPSPSPSATAPSSSLVSSLMTSRDCIHAVAPCTDHLRWLLAIFIFALFYRAGVAWHVQLVRRFQLVCGLVHYGMDAKRTWGLIMISP
ncbi:hypothetical protein B0H14DRAFT_380274 [Mycena olivaceomarginata]|nr:hypothetical protein B0H14DRAFT_380274 [Mycena olivaceomarginata]